MGLLDREEYIEQAYFFRSLVERMRENIPMQEMFAALRDEVLATTKLPMAIDYLLGELKHSGGIGDAMGNLPHYFTPYQTFILRSAEDDRGRFDMYVGFAVLRFLAEFLAGSPTPQAIFLYQFEVLCRNRLGYDRGIDAMANDPIFDGDWREWIRTVRRQIGLVGLGELLYVRSEHYLEQRRRQHGGEVEPEKPILFGYKEGKIALANRKKDPILLFAALQRHLGYPTVPRPVPFDAAPEMIPQLARRMERLETRVKLLEEEQKGGIDITKFYTGSPVRPDETRPSGENPGKEL